MGKKMVVVAFMMVVMLAAGCQVDFQGPSVTAKVFRKDENNGMVYLSRGSGMAGGNAYSAGGGGMVAVGDAQPVWSWGTAIVETEEN